MHLTTLAPPAIVGDALLFLLLVQGTKDWPQQGADKALYALAAWMIFSKFIKLITHFARYPIDILLWPVSPLFGWFHGAIKYYALITLSEVYHVLPGSIFSTDACTQTTWGSRAGADACDSERMKPRPRTPENTFYVNEKYYEKMPLYDDMNSYAGNDPKRISLHLQANGLHLSPTAA